MPSAITTTFFLFLSLAFASADSPSRLVPRQSCSDNYSKCSPSGATTTVAPPVGPALSSMYVDLLDSINPAKTRKRDARHGLDVLDIRSSSADVCCKPCSVVYAKRLADNRIRCRRDAMPSPRQPKPTILLRKLSCIPHQSPHLPNHQPARTITPPITSFQMAPPVTLWPAAIPPMTQLPTSSQATTPSQTAPQATSMALTPPPQNQIRQPSLSQPSTPAPALAVPSPLALLVKSPRSQPPSPGPQSSPPPSPRRLSVPVSSAVVVPWCRKSLRRRLRFPELPLPRRRVLLLPRLPRLRQRVQRRRMWERQWMLHPWLESQGWAFCSLRFSRCESCARSFGTFYIYGNVGELQKGATAAMSFTIFRISLFFLSAQLLCLGRWRAAFFAKSVYSEHTSLLSQALFLCSFMQLIRFRG